MKHKIQVKCILDGTIDLQKAGLTLENFKELSWINQKDIIETYGSLFCSDFIDWVVTEEKQKEDE